MDSPSPVAKLLSSVKIYLDLEKGSGILTQSYIIPIKTGILTTRNILPGVQPHLEATPWWMFNTHSETWETPKAVVLRCVDG